MVATDLGEIEFATMIAEGSQAEYPEYDDLLPVSLHLSKSGDYYLLDRHNDELAVFGKMVEVEEMERIVALINE